MKKLSVILFIYLFLLIGSALSQEHSQVYGIGFYNLENLFDTIHDKGKNDYEYLPEGKNRWSTERYKAKLNNVAMVLNDMTTEVPQERMALVGVCEVENSGVLNDLISHRRLARSGWRYIHFESADSRGIDCALLYNPRLFNPVESCLISYPSESGDRERKSRGFLVVSGDIAQERLHVIVNHWPSRGFSSSARERAGVAVRAIKDSLLRVNPASKVLIMGDFNDNPDDFSVATSLAAKQSEKNVKLPGDLYNPWYNVLRDENRGTIRYKGKWNLFDQIILSGNLLNSKQGLKYHKSSIFVRDYMMQKVGKYKGNPKRTYAGGVWLNGYSDHIPVIIYLINQ